MKRKGLYQPTIEDVVELSGIEVLEIPEAWKFASGDHDLWYIEEHHPAAGLNRALGEFVAAELLRSGSVDE